LYTQRGAASVGADNVFCPQAYEGAVDLDGLQMDEQVLYINIYIYVYTYIYIYN